MLSNSANDVYNRWRSRFNHFSFEICCHISSLGNSFILFFLGFYGCLSLLLSTLLYVVMLFSFLFQISATFFFENNSLYVFRHVIKKNNVKVLKSFV